MAQNRKAELQYLIAKCKAKLNQLQPHLEISEITNELYNKILVEKAVYKRELDGLKEGFFKKLLKIVNKTNPSSRRLICDYIKNWY